MDSGKTSKLSLLAKGLEQSTEMASRQKQREKLECWGLGTPRLCIVHQRLFGSGIDLA